MTYKTNGIVINNMMIKSCHRNCTEKRPGVRTRKNHTLHFTLTIYIVIKNNFVLDKQIRYKRWAANDVNADEQFSIEEFILFLHTEESVHMKDIVVYETIDDMDVDKNNNISMDEYIGNSMCMLHIYYTFALNFRWNLTVHLF